MSHSFSLMTHTVLSSTHLRKCQKVCQKKRLLPCPLLLVSKSLSLHFSSPHLLTFPAECNFSHLYYTHSCYHSQHGQQMHWQNQKLPLPTLLPHPALQGSLQNHENVSDSLFLTRQNYPTNTFHSPTLPNRLLIR